jgi:hypothetical protein
MNTLLTDFGYVCHWSFAPRQDVVLDRHMFRQYSQYAFKYKAEVLFAVLQDRKRVKFRCKAVQRDLRVSKRNIGMHSRSFSCRVQQCCSEEMRKDRIQAESLRWAYPQEIAVAQSPSDPERPAKSSGSS